MVIESVELVAQRNAPTYKEKMYRVRLNTGDALDLFQAHWDVPLSPESLVGLTVGEARTKCAERMLVACVH